MSFDKFKCIVRNMGGKWNTPSTSFHRSGIHYMAQNGDDKIFCCLGQWHTNGCELRF